MRSCTVRRVRGRVGHEETLVWGWTRAALVLAASAATSGCLALPPSRVAIGTGAAFVGQKNAEAPLDIRASVHPLQTDPEALGRSFDFGVGYTRAWSASSRIDGAFVEGQYVLWKTLGPNPLAPRSLAAVRLSLYGQVRVLGERDLPRLGWGGAAGLVVEAATFARTFDGPADHEGLFGRVHGEASSGLYVEGEGARLGETRVWAFSIGIVTRTPAVLVLPLFDRM